VNRTIYFPACAFLLLLALLLLLSEQFSRFSAPHPMLESGKAIDQTAVGKATLIDPYVVGLISDPGIKVSANYQQVDSSIQAVFNKVTRKLRGVQSHLKHHVYQAFNVKVISRHRPTANLVTRIHSWLIGELRLAHTANRRPWKENSDKWTKAQKAAHDPGSRTGSIQGSRAELSRNNLVALIARAANR
jgi:hypothetical protein